MTYADNHPFSPNYVSQIPVTTSDLKRAAALAYIQRQKDAGRSTTSIAETGFRKAITEQARVYTAQCPKCKGSSGPDRKQRRIDGRKQYVCGTCVLLIDAKEFA